MKKNQFIKIQYKALAVVGVFFAFAYASAAQAATLGLSPSSSTVNVGDTFTVDVLLDTQGQAIDGVDIKSLNYNPYYMQVQDADASAGTQITAGSLMPSTVANSVDTVNGKIVLSQITNTGSKYTGSGKLATITFKALVAGNASLTFDFVSGITTDTNVASEGGDVLSSVTNGQYTINNGTTTVNGANPPSTNMPGASGSAALKLINYNGTYYLIQNGVRHGITLPGMLFSYGFALNQAKVATSEDMVLPEGDILLPGDGVLVKTATDKTVWLISGGQRHGFTSATVFSSLGFKFSQVLVVTAPELNKQPQGANVDDGLSVHLAGINITDNGTIYWIGYDGQRHPYPSLTVFNSWNVPNDFSRVLPANNADKSLPVGSTVGMRVLE